jgi:outer membrane protein TolC
VRSDGRLSLGLSGQLAPIWYEGGGHQDTYTTALLLRVPLFSGYSQRYSTLQAQADADRSEADLESLEQQAVFRVWSSYYNLRTAAQRVKTTATLVESASESNEVALGRYKAGVGSILDLLVAQGGLSSARAQQVVARADWFLSLAQLARETGTLWPPPEAPQVVTPSALGTTKGKP